MHTSRNRLTSKFVSLEKYKDCLPRQWGKSGAELHKSKNKYLFNCLSQWLKTSVRRREEKKKKPCKNMRRREICDSDSNVRQEKIGQDNRHQEDTRQGREVEKESSSYYEIYQT